MLDRCAAMRDTLGYCADVATPHPSDPSQVEPAATAAGDATPEQMRAAMADYVAELHGAYLDQAAHLPPGERAELPLVAAGTFTVVAVGTRHLHVLATTAPLPRPTGQEVEISGHDRGLTWTLRFFDPVLVPELAAIDESAGPDALAVRRAVGVADVVYHVSLAPGGGLSAHHAQHAGTGLANAHTSSLRDYDAMRELVPGRSDLVNEFASAQRLGLAIAARLLARELVPRSASIDAADDAVSLRRAVLASLRQPADDHP